MFRWLAVFGVLCLSLLLVSDGVSGEKKKKKKKGISGAVVSLTAAKDKDDKAIPDTYTLVVKTPEKKNKKTGDITKSREHTFEVAKTVKVEKARKKKEPAEPGTIEDIKVGVNVTVFVSQDSPGKVERILVKGRKKKQAD
jgi:uncharacterized protein YhaN